MLSGVLRTEDAEAVALGGQRVSDGVDVPLSLSTNITTAEATEVALTLVALVDDQPISEVPLTLSVRLSIDSTMHLWSDDRAAIVAALTLDARANSLRLTLRFSPTRKRAGVAAHAAAFLAALQEGATLGLRGADGALLPDRLQPPVELAIDDRLVRFLDLLQSVERLSGTPIPVPEEVTQELVDDLLTAQRLLRGEEVTGTWTSGEIRLDRDGLPDLRKALTTASRHEVMHVALMRLELPDAVIELGEIQQVMRDAEVEGVHDDGNELTLRLRAHGGSAPSVMRPARVRATPVACRYEVDDGVFHELLQDLDAPVRESPLRQLLG